MKTEQQTFDERMSEYVKRAKIRRNLVEIEMRKMRMEKFNHTFAIGNFRQTMFIAR